jgi:hydroxyethylthiazole kinase-like uncharacterized protein yjeF
MLSGLPLPPPRPRETHKGAMGRALLIGGSRGMAGAMHLAVGGALRAGPGYVIAALPRELAAGLHQAHPEALLPPLSAELDASGSASSRGELDATVLPTLLELVGSAQAIGIGPGLGQSSATAALLLKLLRTLVAAQPGLPCVLDADALNILAASAASGLFSWSELAPLDLLITPHPGEAARILQGTVPEQRPACWQRLVETTGSCVLLKGAGTLIGDSHTLHEREPYRNPTGNPGMATAGTGDVLTGILVGLLARGMNCVDAARLGAWLHGRAGDLAAEAGSPESLLAGDLIDFLPLAWRDLAHRAPTP